MPNIKQQKKRVRTAASERLENLRYRSTVEDAARSGSQAAVEAGDTSRIADRAPRARPLARPGGRRRARSTGTPPRAARRRPRGSSRRVSASSTRRSAASRGRVMSTSARSSSSSTGEPAAALERVVELGEPDDRLARARPAGSSAPARRASRRRTDAASGAAPPRASSRPSSARRWQSRTRADVARRAGRQRRNRARARVAGALEQRLGRRRAPPATSRRPHASVSVEAAASPRSRGELLDVVHADGIAARPGRDLVDLGRELLRVLADELDEQPARVGVDLDAALGELRRRPISGTRRFGTSKTSTSPAFAQAFASAESFFSSAADEREHRVGRGARRGTRRPPSRRPPSSARPLRRSTSRPPPPKQAERVARRDRVLAAGVGRGEQLDGVLADPVAEPLERALRSSAGRCR